MVARDQEYAHPVGDRGELREQPPFGLGAARVRRIRQAAGVHVVTEEHHHTLTGGGVDGGVQRGERGFAARGGFAGVAHEAQRHVDRGGGGRRGGDRGGACGNRGPPRRAGPGKYRLPPPET